MSVLRPYRLERELDRSVSQWLAWLPRWEPGTARRRGELCPVCPRYADELGLGDLPHGPLHALVASVESLIIEHFLRSAAARFPELERSGDWKVWLDRGVVRLTSSTGQNLDDLLDQEELETTSLAAGRVSPSQAAEARIELVRIYFGLFDSAVSRLATQRVTIIRAVSAYVEPKVQRMVDELVADVCGA